MHPKLSKLWDFLREIVSDWNDHRAGQLGAALAFYSVFSLGPLLLITMAIASFVFGEQAASGELYRSLSLYIGEGGAKAIEALVAGTRTKTTTSGFAAASSLGLLLFTATAVVVQLKEALNIIWGVPAHQTAGLKVVVRKYLVSIIAILSLGFLLLASLVATSVLAFVSKNIGQILPIPSDTLQLINTFMSFGIVMLLFALMFRYLPDAKTEWRDVWIGAAGTAVLFTVGKSVIGLYLGRQSLESTYGAASSFIFLLLWVYYSAQLFFVGAEFTQVYARKYGSRVHVAESARNSVDGPPPPRGCRANIRLVSSSDVERTTPHRGKPT